VRGPWWPRRRWRESRLSRAWARDAQRHHQQDARAHTGRGCSHQPSPCGHLRRVSRRTSSGHRLWPFESVLSLMREKQSRSNRHGKLYSLSIARLIEAGRQRHGANHKQGDMTGITCVDIQYADTSRRIRLADNSAEERRRPDHTPEFVAYCPALQWPLTGYSRVGGRVESDARESFLLTISNCV
jgi:hypothetical protein